MEFFVLEPQPENFGCLLSFIRCVIQSISQVSNLLPLKLQQFCQNTVIFLFFLLCFSFLFLSCCVITLETEWFYSGAGLMAMHTKRRNKAFSLNKQEDLKPSVHSNPREAQQQQMKANLVKPILILGYYFYYYQIKIQEELLS